MLLGVTPAVTEHLLHATCLHPDLKKQRPLLGLSSPGETGSEVWAGPGFDPRGWVLYSGGLCNDPSRVHPEALPPLRGTMGALGWGCEQEKDGARGKQRHSPTGVAQTAAPSLACRGHPSRREEVTQGPYLQDSREQAPTSRICPCGPKMPSKLSEPRFPHLQSGAVTGQPSLGGVSEERQPKCFGIL